MINRTIFRSSAVAYRILQAKNTEELLQITEKHVQETADFNALFLKVRGMRDRDVLFDDSRGKRIVEKVVGNLELLCALARVYAENGKLLPGEYIEGIYKTLQDLGSVEDNAKALCVLAACPESSSRSYKAQETVGRILATLNEQEPSAHDIVNICTFLPKLQQIRENPHSKKLLKTLEPYVLKVIFP